jgi:hypothetical protein
VAGLSNERSPHAALAMVVPAALAAPIEAIRQVHDPAFSRWPPHANFLFPFVADERGRRRRRAGATRRRAAGARAAVSRDAGALRRVSVERHAVSARRR